LVQQIFLMRMSLVYTPVFLFFTEISRRFLFGKINFLKVDMNFKGGLNCIYRNFDGLLISTHNLLHK